MNVLTDGNVDVKTTSVQKNRVKGPTKEATGTTTSGWGATRTVFCCLSLRELQRSTTAHTEVFPPEPEARETKDGRRMKEWETMPGHRRATSESVREHYNGPAHGYTQQNQRTKIMPPDSKEQGKPKNQRNGKMWINRIYEFVSKSKQGQPPLLRSKV